MLPYLLFHTLLGKTTRPDRCSRAVHQYLLLSAALSPTPSISFLNLHNSVIQLSFLLLLILLHSSSGLLLLLQSTFLHFFFSHSISSFPSPRRLHRANFFLRSCRKYKKVSIPTCPAEQCAHKLPPPETCQMYVLCVCHSCAGSHEADKGERSHSLITCSHSQ